MSGLLDQVVALARPGARAAAAAALGAALGGDRLIVFVRDEQVGALLPAPGFPQTLPNARAWRRLLDACAARGEGRAEAVTPPGGSGAPVPAYGFSSGPDVVAVVLGTDRRPDRVEEVRELLPLLAQAYLGERAAAHAEARARLAREAESHANALAAALDQMRAQLQRALVEAESARRALEAANRQLRTQAEEMAAQATKLQGINAELGKARVEAEAANAAKGEFLAVMSHELRTPLNAISGHVQLIDLGIYGPVTEAQRDALARIDRNQRHLLGLINNILNFAKLEAGRVEYRIEDVRLGDLLADLQSMIGPQLRAKRLRYEVCLAEPSLGVRADREKLQQLLLNLLSNAVKFTDHGGRIMVEGERLQSAPGGVVVRVRDTGIGISEDKLEEIFEPFVQVDGSLSRAGQGTGLGLAISRNIARGMGGELRVHSRLGEGSTFTLTLLEAAPIVHSTTARD